MKEFLISITIPMIYKIAAEDENSAIETIKNMISDENLPVEISIVKETDSITPLIDKTGEVYRGKVIDEVEEWVTGDLIVTEQGYYISQTVENNNSCCGIGIFAVDKDTIIKLGDK